MRRHRSDDRPGGPTWSVLPSNLRNSRVRSEIRDRLVGRQREQRTIVAPAESSARSASMLERSSTPGRRLRPDPCLEGLNEDDRRFRNAPKAAMLPSQEPEPGHPDVRRPVFGLGWTAEKRRA